LFSFLVVCSDIISKGLGLVAFFASVTAISVCIHLSCPVCIQSVVHGVPSRLFCGHTGCNLPEVSITSFLPLQFFVSVRLPESNFLTYIYLHLKTNVCTCPIGQLLIVRPHSFTASHISYTPNQRSLHHRTMNLYQ
jgi:hypothetical protein